MILNWQKPETIPDVPEGTEREFWIAVHAGVTGKDHVFIAMFQNRPLRLDKDGDPKYDWVLCEPDGEYIESVRWVHTEEHPEFDDFYSPINFSDHYTLLGWAEYTPPAFTGFDGGGDFPPALVVMTGKEIADLAMFVGYSVRKRYAELESTRVAVHECPATGILSPAGEKARVSHYNHVAMYAGDPAVGCYGLGDPISVEEVDLDDDEPTSEEEAELEDAAE